MITSTGVRRAHTGDVDALAELIATAFVPLAVSHWLVPDPVARASVFPAYFRILVDHALKAGWVETTLDRHAVALWIPDQASPLPGYEQRVEEVSGPYLPRFKMLDAAFESHRPPAAPPHHHMAILAVQPERQNARLGATLLGYHHRQLELDGTSAYLEASSPDARRFYLRHGYEDIPGGRFHLPADGPPIWPMWRGLIDSEGNWA